MKERIYEAVPVPFACWCVCGCCGLSFVQDFPIGRPATPESRWLLPCPNCQKRAVAYSSPLILAN